MLNSCTAENTVDPDQLASKKTSDQEDPRLIENACLQLECCQDKTVHKNIQHTNGPGPLADSHEIKGFFIKAILGKIKVVSL